MNCQVLQKFFEYRDPRQQNLVPSIKKNVRKGNINVSYLTKTTNPSFAKSLLMRSQEPCTIRICSAVKTVFKCFPLLPYWHSHSVTLLPIVTKNSKWGKLVTFYCLLTWLTSSCQISPMHISSLLTAIELELNS